jgi:prepilin-type N-terminal cleavage/methylation domain-containing protein/prepilin-type processing-associated H-X9-DG protein
MTRNRCILRGFTLIELLVVIAIISTLASMLMPTFARAKEQARKIVCVSNLKQVGFAVAMYTADHDDCYPVAWAFWGPVNSPPLPTTPNLKTCLNPYIKNDQIWWCPSWSGIYGMNAWGNPDGGGYDFIVPSTSSFEVIAKPGDNTAYSEAALNAPTDYPLVWCGSHWTSSLNAHSGVPDVEFFSGSGVGGTNILFADTHAKFMRFNRSQFQQIYSTPR